MAGGWTKLYDSIFDWEWWADANMVKAFIALLLSCKHKETNWCGIVIKPGQFVTTLAELSERLNMTIRQVRTVLSRLVQTGEITVETTNRYSLITVCNWTLYQSEKIDNLEMPQDESDKSVFCDGATNKRQTNDKQSKKRKRKYQRKRRKRQRRWRDDFKYIVE